MKLFSASKNPEKKSSVILKVSSVALVSPSGKQTIYRRKRFMLFICFRELLIYFCLAKIHTVIQNEEQWVKTKILQLEVELFLLKPYYYIKILCSGKKNQKSSLQSLNICVGYISFLFDFHLHMKQVEPSWKFFSCEGTGTYFIHN